MRAVARRSTTKAAAKGKAEAMSEVDRIALVLWHTAQLSTHGRRYVLAAIATADAILNGAGPAD